MQNYTLEQSKKIYNTAKSQGLDGKKVIYLMAKDGANFDGLDTNEILSYGKQNYETAPVENKSIGKDSIGGLKSEGSLLDTLKNKTTDQASKNLGADVKEIGTNLQERGQNIADIQQARQEGQSAVADVTKMLSPEAGAKVEEFTKNHPVLAKIAQTLLPDISTVGQIAGGAQDIVGGIFNIVTPDKLKEFGAEKAKELASTAFGQAGIKTMEDYNAWATKYPMAAKNVEGLANIGLTAADLLGGGEAATATANTAKTAGRLVGESAEAFAKRTGQIATDIATAATDTARTAKNAVKNTATAVADKSGVAPVLESVGATMGSAARRGKEAVVDSVQEAKRVAALPVAEKKAVRSGLDSGVIDFVKTSSKQNIPVYEKVVNAAKNSGLRDGTAAKKVVGQQIIDTAVKPALKLRDKVGAKIGAIVKNLPKEKMNIAPYVDEFVNTLESVGVTVGRKGKLIAGQGAVVGDLPAYQNMFNRIRKGVASQKDLHEIRSAVFKEFNLAKARQQAFSDSADRVAEQFRSILGKGIKDKNYLKYSKEYSDIMSKITDFVKYTSHKGDLESLATKDLKIAEVAQRVLGNASARPQEVLDAIVSLADKAGKKGLSKDLSDSIRFSDLIEDFYGMNQTRSIGGQMARGTKAGIEGATNAVVEGAANGGLSGMIGGAVKGVLGKTTAEQQKALEELIKSLK